MYTVYKITNLINKKIYIGCTKQPLSVRFSGSYNTRLKSDLALYGKKNFTIEAIFQTANPTTARIAETNNIMLHESTNPEYGYNIDRTSDYPDLAEYAKNWTPKQEAHVYMIDEIEKRLLDATLEEFRGSLQQENLLIEQRQKECQQKAISSHKTFSGIGTTPQQFLSKIGYKEPEKPFKETDKTYPLGGRSFPPLSSQYMTYVGDYPWLLEQALHVLNERHKDELFPAITTEELESVIKERMEIAGVF